jgi:hypothetical protein
MPKTLTARCRTLEGLAHRSGPRGSEVNRGPSYVVGWTTECLRLPPDDASNRRGARPCTLSQLALRSGWRASGGRSPNAPDPPPPERLSLRQVWLLRGGAVLRAHDVLAALSWSLLGVDMDVPSWLQFLLPPIVSVRRARGHCLASHDLSLVISRDDKRSKNACIGDMSRVGGAELSR